MNKTIENEKLRIYEAARSVPLTAQRTIKGGRISGFTDINPMWRIKKLTELYGPCGTGWYYEVLTKEVIDGAEGEKIAVVDINLYVKEYMEWSKGIFGTGGSMLVAAQKGGLYTSDEAFKMALTDAISVSCKALGIGADIYWEKDVNKYQNSPQSFEQNRNKNSNSVITKAQQQHLFNEFEKEKIKDIIGRYGYVGTAEIKKADYEEIVSALKE